MPILQPSTTRIASGTGGFTDLYVVAGGGAGGGTTIPGSLLVGGPVLEVDGGPSGASALVKVVGTVAQVVAQDATGSRVRLATTAGVGAVSQTNSAGVPIAPGLVFTGGELQVVDAAANVQATFPAAGGLSMSSLLSMNNQTIALGSGAALFFDVTNTLSVATFPVGRAFVVAETGTGAVASIAADGVNAAAYSSQPNNTLTPISVPTATPTTIFTIPLNGAPGYIQMWKILVGYSDGATNYETTFVDVGVYWLGTTSPHYVVAATGQLPVGWSLAVPTIGSGDVEFTHTFGSNLAVSVSAFVVGLNTP